MGSQVVKSAGRAVLIPVVATTEPQSKGYLKISQGAVCAGRQNWT